MISAIGILAACLLTGSAFGQVETEGCPSFELFQSLDVAVTGDRISLNIVSTGGSLKPEEVKFDWRVYPPGNMVVSPDTTKAWFDTSTVKENWAIVSVDFANWRRCNWHGSSRTINIRRKGPYTSVDEFWWWFQLNAEEFQAYKMPEYHQWLDRLNALLRLIDPNLTYRFDRERLDPINTGFILDYKGKVSTKLINDIVARAPKIAGWEFLAEKAPKN